MHNAGSEPPQNGATTRDDTGPERDRDEPVLAAPHDGGAAVASAITAAAAMLRLARAIATGGRPVDLTGLDEQMGRICAQALDLPPAEGTRLRADLAGLLGELDALAVALRHP
ncbi:MAG: hypothetical protein KGK10_06430 [Rhodospirillales bacterium]|nr:hypothetical protein [Rhodospirillales bacterium]